MRYTASDLAAALTDARETDYIRLAATWLTRNAEGDDGPEPALTGKPVVDALTAATAALAARSRGQEPPSWASKPARVLPGFWHPGGTRFFAYSLAHTPADFLVRGLVVELDSLVSV